MDYSEQEDQRLQEAVHKALRAWLAYRARSGVLGVPLRRAIKYLSRRVGLALRAVELRGEVQG